MASSQVLIRDLPPVLTEWIEQEKKEKQASQNEVLVSALLCAMKHRREPELFDPDVLKEQISVPPCIPFKFIDLFAGIGGMRIGLERVGGQCVFTSEWDKYCQKTYKAWFGDMPSGDITKIDPRTIPDHDVLAAGFPCQPFSIAGVSKKNSLGRAHGFKDKAQGTLFFHVVEIAEIKRPSVILLENVKNLLSHDKGNTWKVILENLQGLGYKVFFKILNAASWVPQHRERIIIVCFDPKVFGENPPFTFPEEPKHKPVFRDILEALPDDKYTLTDHLWDYLQAYAKKHQEKGNGFGFGMTRLDGVSRTLSARYYKDGSEVLIPQNGRNPRRLTPREAARLMGFPDKYQIVVSDTQAYKQFGNAIVPLLVEAVGKQIVQVFAWNLRKQKRLFRNSEQIPA
jgi:DNA (cytosine-5)-methyltransferase 1